MGNNESLRNQLQQILSKSSTIALVTELEIGFNQTPKSFAKISESTVKMNEYIKEDIIKQNKAKKIKKTKPLKKKTSSPTAHDNEYDDVAIYQSAVYGNDQMVISKQKKSKNGKKKSKKKNNKKSKNASPK